MPPSNVKEGMLIGHRAVVGNSLDTAYVDVVDDSVGDTVLKLVNILEIE